MQPEAVLRTDSGDRCHRIHARARRRTDRGDHRDRPVAGRDVRLDRGSQRGDVHAERVVDRDAPASLLAEAEHDARLLHR